MSKFDKDSLGTRMKDFYESVPKTRLIPKMPVLARMDGRAFHTLTRKCVRPYDFNLNGCMIEAAKTLCNDIAGCKLAYIESDEISLLITDWETYTTQSWFGYEVQKMCSISGAVCASAFNAAFQEKFGKGKLAAFDGRFWNIPLHEVTNYFIWRQQDAVRNSISMLAQSQFSHKELIGKNCNEMQDMLIAKGINWNDQPTRQKRGVCVYRQTVELPLSEVIPAERYANMVALGKVVFNQTTVRSSWVVDLEVPIFSQDREYIEKFLPEFP